VFAAVALGLAIATVYVGLFVLLVVDGWTRGADYTAFYTGWTIVLQGRGPELYDPAVQAEVQRTVLGGQSFAAGLNPFNNPPYAVLPFVPLALLPLEPSFLVWTCLNVVLLASILLVMLRTIAAGWSGRERAALVALAVAFPPTAIVFFQGAFSLLLLGGVLAGVVGVVARPVRAGAALAVAAIKPQGVFGAGLALAAGRRWRAAGASLVVLAALALAATIVLGPGTWASYVRFLAGYLSSFDVLSVDPAAMWNLRGTLTLALGRDSPGLVNGLAYLGFAVGVVLVLATWTWQRPPTMDPRDPGVAIRWSLTVCLTALFAPHLNPHDDVVLILAAALAWAALRGTRVAAPLAIGVATAPALILLTNGLRADAPTDLPIRVPTLLLLLLTVVVATAMARRPWATPTGPTATAAAG
jgi:hypothetical protein